MVNSRAGALTCLLVARRLYKLFINPLLASYVRGVKFLSMKKETTRHADWSWEGTTAFFCFTGGIGAALVGCILTATTWVVGAQLHPWLHGLGTALLIVTIPLLIFAGYCLDWAERGPKKPEQSLPK